MAGTSVGERLEQVKSRVRSACAAHGRDPASVHVLAVSKLHDIHAIRAAYDHGQRDFAENYAQEALGKLDQLASLPVAWHFIGRIQTNKLKLLANRFAVIHSVDRLEVAEKLNALTRERQDIFLQFNVAAESSKGGADEAGLRALAAAVVSQCPRLRLRGVMVMPPLDQPARPFFARARELTAEIRATFDASSAVAHPFDELSMGTSADFEDAIAEGATWIRIGTDIFGPREEKT